MVHVQFFADTVSDCSLEVIPMSARFEFPAPKRVVNLSEEESAQLAILLKKAGNGDLMKTPWHALVKIFPTVPLELMIFNNEQEVLLIYREDAEFVGWHHPGSCWNDWETIPQRLGKLVAGEVVKGAGIAITEPKNIGWMEAERGDDISSGSSDRHACSLIYVADLISEFTPKEGFGFFPLHGLPENTFYHHKYILSRVAQYLADGQMIHD